VAYRKRREQRMEICCLAASVAEAFPWCKTPGEDVVVDRKTIARDVGFFLVFFAATSAARVVELSPLATELPEKINSVLWVRDGKDTLALGNITGAMVFQSTVLVTFGVLFTGWELGMLNLFCAALALVSGTFIYIVLRPDAALRSWHLMIGGIFYLAFLLAAVLAVI
jgi:Ca2+/Na+ antiporter